MEGGASWLSKESHTVKDIKEGEDNYIITDDDSRTKGQRTIFMTSVEYQHSGHENQYKYRDNLQYINGEEVLNHIHHE